MHTILLVEDEAALSNALTLKLESLGYKVTHVGNGTEAIEKLENESFDLVLLDLIIPDINGFEVLRIMKDQHIDTKVIVTSNLSQSEDMEKAKEYGVVDYIVKADTSLNEVVDRIKRAIDT